MNVGRVIYLATVMVALIAAIVTLAVAIPIWHLPPELWFLVVFLCAFLLLVWSHEG